MPKRTIAYEPYLSADSGKIHYKVKDAPRLSIEQDRGTKAWSVWADRTANGGGMLLFKGERKRDLTGVLEVLLEAFAPLAARVRPR